MACFHLFTLGLLVIYFIPIVFIMIHGPSFQNANFLTKVLNIKNILKGSLILLIILAWLKEF